MTVSSTRSAAIKAAIATLAMSTALVGQAATAGNASALKPLTCKAHMSDYHPSHNETVDVLVKTKRHAHVTTTAHYKTTSTTHSARANGHGRASIGYDISDATYGYKVHVSVTVRKHGHSGSCSTWFTPRS